MYAPIAQSMVENCENLWSPMCLSYSKEGEIGSPLRMNEVCNHWKKFRFDEDDVMKDEKSNISILTKWEVIQDIFLKAGDNMKLHIKEQLRKIAYPKTTDLKPLSQLIKIKGAPKNLKPTSSDNSTMKYPSYFEHVDKVFPVSPTPKTQQRFF